MKLTAPKTNGTALTNGVPAVATNGVGAAAGVGEAERLVNVIASGSVDQTIKVWVP